MEPKSQKECTLCHEVKVASEFFLNPKHSTGLTSWCRVCSKAKSNEYHEQRNNRNPVEPVSCKICVQCKKEQPASEFYVSRHAMDGLVAACKICTRNYRQRKRQQKLNSFPNICSSDKWCSQCKETRPAIDFHLKRTNADGLAELCRFCCTKRGRNNYLRRRYGITEVQYNAMIEKQGDVCAICLQPETLVHLGKIAKLQVDHNHKTGLARKLLCNSCNHDVAGVEHAKETNLLEVILHYLQEDN